MFTLNKTSLEITEFGSGSLIDIPLSYIVDNYILILSPLKKVNTSEIKKLVNKFKKSINKNLQKNESNSVESPLQKPTEKKVEDDSEEEDDD
jgi:hypothetical protein